MPFSMPSGWRARSPSELVALSLEVVPRMKLVGPELDTRPPDEAGATRVIQAYEAGAAAPWLTAYLLGCVGHERGYGTARAILLAAPGSLAESYAGTALAKIRGVEAYEDLVELMNHAPQRDGRDGAAYGLVHLGTSRAAAAVLDAALSRTIHLRLAAMVAHLPIDPTRVATLLCGDERGVRIGIELLCSWLSDEDRVERFAADRAAWVGLVERALGDPELFVPRHQRELLTRWAAAESPP